MYVVKSYPLINRLYNKNLLWEMPLEKQPILYLSFDDGPHPVATPFVLEELKKHNAKATFFCIGKNVELYPEIYQRIIDEGHVVGNHTQNHLNGFQYSNIAYLKNVYKASKWIQSKLFRPPYGRIMRAQAKRLLQEGWKIVMWNVLSGDFDEKISPEKCLENIMANIAPSQIIVFHDSTKAWQRMRFALPQVLDFCSKNNWQLKGIA